MNLGLSTVNVLWGRRFPPYTIFLARIYCRISLPFFFPTHLCGSHFYLPHGGKPSCAILPFHALKRYNFDSYPCFFDSSFQFILSVSYSYLILFSALYTCLAFSFSGLKIGGIRNPSFLNLGVFFF